MCLKADLRNNSHALHSYHLLVSECLCIHVIPGPFPLGVGGSTGTDNIHLMPEFHLMVSSHPGMLCSCLFP